MSVPDYPLGQTLDFKFTSRAFATGVPTVLAGTPVIEVYEDNSVTQITAGETLTVDFDSVVGLNNLRIVATGANGYEVGKSYQAIISVGTVDGTSVVGEVVAQFSIERSAALMPTVAGRTLDVTATGEAGLDLGNVTGVLGNADVSWVDGSDRIDLGLWLGSAPNALAGGRVDTRPSLMGADTVNASALAADAVAEIADGIWDEDATAHQTLGTFGQAIGDPVANAETIYEAVVTDAAGANVAADIIAVQSDTDDIQTRLPAALVGGAMDADVSAIQNDAITAAAIAANAIGASELATDAIGDAQIATGAIAATAFAAGAVDAAAIATDAIGSAELATSAVNEIRDSILSDATTFAGANINATISSRAQPSDLGYPETNQAFDNIEFLMVDSTDHVTPETGLTPTGQRSIDGGAFGAVAGSIAEIGVGIYQFDATAADMNGGTIMFRFSDAAADDTFVFIKTRT